MINALRHFTDSSVLIPPIARTLIDHAKTLKASFNTGKIQNLSLVKHEQ